MVQKPGRRFDEIKTRGFNRVSIAGSFRPKGSSAPEIVKGHGWTISRKGLGDYTLTFDDSFPGGLERFVCSARVADATPTLVQPGPFSSESREISILTKQRGATSALTRSIPLDLSAARIVDTNTIDLRDIGDVVLGSTPPTFDATVGGYAFDADAEFVWLHFRVPADWAQGTDLTFSVVWHAEDGSAIPDTETVIWLGNYYVRQPGEAVNGGTVEAVSGTYTQSGPGTDKQEIRTTFTLAAAASNQPLSAGASIYLQLSRDKTNDTYADDAIVTRLQLKYSRTYSLLEAITNEETPLYLQRVNGGTDPAFRVRWTKGNVGTLWLPPFQWPQDMDEATACTFSVSTQMAGATDTPVIAVAAFENLGDTNFGGNTAALSNSVANKTVTLAAGNISGYPSFVNLNLTPGTHNTDDLYIYGAQVTYTSLALDSEFALADLSDDPDNVINFEATFINCTDLIDR